MSSWISKDGVFHPAKEKVGLTNNGKPFKNPKTGEMVNTGDPYIYEGPCRAALFDLWEIDKTGGTTTLGMDFQKSPEFLQMLRELKFNNVEEYLVYAGYDKKKVEADFAEKSAEIKKHELPSRIMEIKRLGGGFDATGKGEDVVGGFGEPQVVPLSKG